MGSSNDAAFGKVMKAEVTRWPGIAFEAATMDWARS